MSTTSQVPATTQALTAKALFARDDVKQRFQEMLGKKAPGFITSVLQIIAQNQMLSQCDPTSVYQAAAVAATLDLPLNNNLGFAYIIPYQQSFKTPQGTWEKRWVAQFQIGYKGFIQLAQRSGQFKTISAAPIYDGQLVEENPLTGFQFDFTKKKSDRVIGYAAFFQLLNGFEKTLFSTVADLEKHGVKYSKTFNNEKGLWKQDFNAMATKTVLKLLLSKFAPLSIEMQKAVITDQGVINNAETIDVTYVDNQHEPVDKEAERLTLMIQDAKTQDELESLRQYVTPDLQEVYETKINSLKH